MLTPSTCSPDTATLWGFLPQFVQDSDAGNGYPFLSWLEGPCSLLQATDTLARDQGQNPGWSILLDVTRCPTADLPWLAQFVGVRFSSLQTTDAQMRAAITGEQGFQRGTVDALIAAAATFLTTTSGVVVTERYEGDPYKVLVTVPGAGVLGTWFYVESEYATWNALEAAFATWNALGGSGAQLVAVMQAALPAGLVLTVAYD
jgi:hypothetical protein